MSEQNPKPKPPDRQTIRAQALEQLQWLQELDQSAAFQRYQAWVEKGLRAHEQKALDTRLSMEERDKNAHLADRFRTIWKFVPEELQKTRDQIRAIDETPDHPPSAY